MTSENILVKTLSATGSSIAMTMRSDHQCVWCVVQSMRINNIYRDITYNDFYLDSMRGGSPDIRL